MEIFSLKLVPLNGHSGTPAFWLCWGCCAWLATSVKLTSGGYSVFLIIVLTREHIFVIIVEISVARGEQPMQAFCFI